MTARRTNTPRENPTQAPVPKDLFGFVDMFPVARSDIRSGDYPSAANLAFLLRRWPVGRIAKAFPEPLSGGQFRLEASEQREFLDYVADRLEGKVKRKRGRPSEPFEWWREFPKVYGIRLLQAFYTLRQKRAKAYEAAIAKWAEHAYPNVSAARREASVSKAYYRASRAFQRWAAANRKRLQVPDNTRYDFDPPTVAECIEILKPLSAEARLGLVRQDTGITDL